MTCAIIGTTAFFGTVVTASSAVANVTCESVKSYSLVFHSSNTTITSSANAGGSCAGAHWTRVIVCPQTSDDDSYWTDAATGLYGNACKYVMTQCDCYFTVTPPTLYGVSDGWYRLQIKLAQYDSAAHNIGAGTVIRGNLHLTG
jgi:hypothetical protein